MKSGGASPPDHMVGNAVSACQTVPFEDGAAGIFNRQALGRTVSRTGSGHLAEKVTDDQGCQSS